MSKANKESKFEALIKELNLTIDTSEICKWSKMLLNDELNRSVFNTEDFSKLPRFNQMYLLGCRDTALRRIKGENK